MATFKAHQPRANPPVCWGCDKKLYAGGRIYSMVGGHPYHEGCAPDRCGCGKSDCVTCMPDPTEAT